MDEKRLQKSLKKSGELATITYCRALAHSLLNKAFDQIKYIDAEQVLCNQREPKKNHAPSFLVGTQQGTHRVFQHGRNMGNNCASTDRVESEWNAAGQKSASPLKDGQRSSLQRGAGSGLSTLSEKSAHSEKSEMSGRNKSESSGKSNLSLKFMLDGEHSESSMPWDPELPLKVTRDTQTESVEQQAHRPQIPVKIPSSKPCLMKLDDTMRKLSEHMSQMSFECELYYDSCPLESISRADRRHLRAFHRGLLRSKKKKRQEERQNTTASGPGNDTEVYECSEGAVPHHHHHHHHHRPLPPDGTDLVLESPQGSVHTLSYGPQATIAFNYTQSPSTLPFDTDLAKITGSSLPLFVDPETLSDTSSCLSFDSVLSPSSSKDALKRRSFEGMGTELREGKMQSHPKRKAFPHEGPGIKLTKAGVGFCSQCYIQGAQLGHAYHYGTDSLEQETFLSTSPGYSSRGKHEVDTGLHLIHIGPGRSTKFGLK